MKSTQILVLLALVACGGTPDGGPMPNGGPSVSINPPAPPVDAGPTCRIVDGVCEKDDGGVGQQAWHCEAPDGSFDFCF